jgi:hypothetical protein
MGAAIPHPAVDRHVEADEAGEGEAHGYDEQRAASPVLPRRPGRLRLLLRHVSLPFAARPSVRPFPAGRAR